MTDTVTLTTSPRAKSRPFTLKAVCLLLLLRSVLFGLLAALLFAGTINLDEVDFLESLDAAGLISVMAVLAGLFLVLAIGLWLLRPWAWRLTMIAMGGILTLSLWNQFSGDGSVFNAIGLSLNIFIVFYLVQSDIRVLFDSGEEAQRLS